MGPVDVSIGHNDDFFVAKVFFFVTVLDTAAQRLDHVLDFLVLGNLVKRSGSHIQDFAPQRQNRLRHAVASLFGGTARRIALDDKNFGIFGRRFRTVGQFARQAQPFGRAFAVLDFLFLFPAAELRTRNHVFHQRRGVFGIGGKPVVERILDRLFDQPHRLA